MNRGDFHPLCDACRQQCPCQLDHTYRSMTGLQPPDSKHQDKAQKHVCLTTLACASVLKFAHLVVCLRHAAGFLDVGQRPRCFTTPVESAPFKLTAEFVDLMGGPSSACFKGFREVRDRGGWGGRHRPLIMRLASRLCLVVVVYSWSMGDQVSRLAECTQEACLCIDVEKGASRRLVLDVVAFSAWFSLIAAIIILFGATHRYRMNESDFFFSIRTAVQRFKIGVQIPAWSKSFYLLFFAKNMFGLSCLSG